MNASHDDHLSYEESAGAYVLDALTDEETRAFEAHLEGCMRCRADVADLRLAAEALPASAPPVPPPPELKERIMSIVRAEAELLQAAGDRADVPPAPRREHRGWRWLTGSLRLRPVVALAAAASVLVLGGALGLALNSAGGTHSRTIVATVDHKAAPNGSAELRVVGGSGTLRVTGLRNPSGGRVYQVWVQRGEQNPTPTNALFSVRADGTASVSVPDLHGVKQVMVTAEPPGGSSMPSEAPVIAVSTA